MIQLLIPSGERGGVYDFASKLIEELGCDTAAVVPLSRANTALWDSAPGDIIFLQFSGYGFEKRGVPLWLLRELEQRRAHLGTLGVFFHELYAFGPPWSSSFWLSPVQRHIARRLAELSDFWMTNREASAQWLRRFARDKPHMALPVFSNVGESAATTGERAPRIIVFGGAGLRQKTYQAAGEKLVAWAKQASLEIHDIGPLITDAGLSATLHSSGVIQHGQLDANEVDRLMGDALYGVLAYPVEYVAKSGVFAAYCAHGMCPLLISNDHTKADGLVRGVHFLSDVPVPDDMPRAEQIGRAAREWYRFHNLQSYGAFLRTICHIGSAYETQFSKRS